MLFVDDYNKNEVKPERLRLRVFISCKNTTSRSNKFNNCVRYFTNADRKDLENSESGPAMDKECLKYGKRNHFKAKYKSKGVKAAGLDDGESSEMYKHVAAVKQLVTLIHNNESR